MTAEQYKAKFVDEYNKLCERTGHRIEGSIIPRMLGNVLQSEVRLDVVPIENWQAPISSGDDKTKD